MENIFFTLVPIFGIMLIGAFSEHFRFLPKETAYSIGQFVYWIGIPMLLFYLMATANVDDISYKTLLSSAFALLITNIVSVLLVLALKFTIKESIMIGMLSAYGNTFFMGIPTVMLLYPDNAQALTVASLVAIITIPVYVFSDILLSINFNTKSQDKEKNNFISDIFKKTMTNPTLIAALFGCIVALIDIKVPYSLLEIARMLGSTAAPCALFCMGISLYLQAKNFKYSVNDFKSNYLIQCISLSMKLAFLPLLAYLLATFTGADNITKAAVTIMSGLPAAVVCHVVAVRHNTLINLTVNSTFLGTLLSIITLPILILLVF